MKAPISTLVSCVVAGALTFACNKDSSHGPAPPAPSAAPAAEVTVALQAPEADMTAEAGTPLRIDYVDTGPVDDTTTTLYADEDGDLSTTGDQHVIDVDRPVRDGTAQTVLWDTSYVPSGVYAILARTTDWANGITATDIAGGWVTITPSLNSPGHMDVVLKDRWGVPLGAGSAEPYSPRATCGGCHCIDEIANGYHFQQGRTDERGRLVMKEDYFADGRQWLKSAGMYGKW